MSAAADPAYSPREWIGDDEYPWPPTLGLADGEGVAACFTVTQLSLGRTRSDAPFLRLVLTDSYGSVEARMWDDVEAVADHLRVGAYVGVRGVVETYQDQRQLQVHSLALLRVELDDLVLFLPRSARSPERMNAELAAAIDSIDDAPLRHLLALLLDASTETGHAFRLAPAAKQNHHAYLGGLLEHTLSVARVCDMLVAHYGAALDRDLLIAGALLHDIGKIREIGARAGFPYTDEGKLLGHIVIGMQMVADAARGVPDLAESRLLLLQHLIASHQGRFEWQSPREPRILEAVLLHYVDDLDAKLNQAGNLVDAVTGGWTAFDRSLGRDFLRHRTHDTPALPQPRPAVQRGREASRSPVGPPAAPLPDEAAATPAAPDGGDAAATAHAPQPGASGPAHGAHPAGAAGAAGAADGVQPAESAPPQRSPSDPLGTLDLFDA